MNISQYPREIQDRVAIRRCAYGGSCKPVTSLTYEVRCNEYTLHHEMGHAAAKILGIEVQLAQMVWDLPGSETLTNDNIFNYGAQDRQRGDFRKARAEYAADAIRAYVLDCPELPKHIRNFIKSAFDKARYTRSIENGSTN